MKFIEKAPVKHMFSNKDLFSLFFPLVIEQGLEYLVGLADSLMVAQVGESAVSGVSLVDFIMALLISIFAAIATGGAVVVGQHMGAGQEEKAKETVNQLVKLALVASISIMILIFILRPFILYRLFGSITDDVRSAAGVYFMIVVPSIPFLALYNVGAAIFRTKGNSKLPMKIMLAMNILNVFGNAICVYVLKMGVAGIALPTLISRIGAAVIILFLAAKEKQELRIHGWLRTPFHNNTVRRILSIGAPFAFENGMFYLGRLVVLSVVAKFGTASIAANSVGGTIIMFEVLPGMAINLGLSVVISKCVGAGDYQQAKYYTKKVGAVIHVCFMISSAVVLLLMPLILRIYGLSDEATLMTWQIAISHAVLMCIIWPAGYMLPVVFRGAGEAKFPMVVSTTTMIICRIMFSYVFSLGFGMGMFATWVAMYLDWFAKAAIYMLYYKQDKWIQMKS
ncbi:putative inner membrane protein [Lachnospiraceae bacterium KM106-2]|nr:putative inner membrane protein [Lachnospiraceae bacterium KM106-2]